MSLSESSLIMGIDPVAQAICQVLELFGTKCHKYQNIPNDVLEDKAQSKEFLKTLGYPDIVIAITPSALQVIPLVYQLRTDLDWAGKFIAIVPNMQQIESLNKLGLFGEPNVTSYGDILGKGHAVSCLEEPNLLIHLINLIYSEAKLKPLYWSEWEKLLNMWNLPRKINEIIELAQHDSLNEAINKVDETMNEFKKINSGFWEIWLNHDDKSSEILINNYQKENINDIDRCLQIANNIKDILVKCKLGGLL